MNTSNEKESRVNVPAIAMAMALQECLEGFFLTREDLVFNTASSDISALQALKWLDLTHKQKIQELIKLNGWIINKLQEERNAARSEKTLP